MKNLVNYTKLVLLTSVLLKINSGYASQNEYDNTQSSSMASNAMPAQQDPFSFRSLPADAQGEIMGHLDRKTLSSYSQADKNAYHSVHSPNEDGFRNPISEKILNLQEPQSFDLDKPKEIDRLISFLQYTQTHNRLVDININVSDSSKIDWKQILPLCTYIRFITFNNDSDWKKTPLLLAAQYQLNDIAVGIVSTLKENNPAWLKEYKEYMDIMDSMANALGYSTGPQGEKTALLLIEAGPELTTIFPRGETTLLIDASTQGSTDVVNILINKMRETNPQGLQQYLNHMNRDNKTALMIANEKGYSDIVTILQQAGATQ